MKRILLVAVVVIAALSAAVVWWMNRGNGDTFGLVVTPNATCGPSNTLAGIEGWAPGASHANEMGNNGAAQIGGFGGALGGGTPEPTTAPSCVPDPPANVLLAQLALLRKIVPQEDIDVAVRATTTATTQGAFTFVRDSIRLDNYSGVLRGATGVLLTGAGNADDKALLLAALLQKQGISVRYARSTLSDAEASTLAAAAAAPATPMPEPTIPPDSLTPLGLTQNDLAHAAAQTVSQTANALPDAVKLGISQASALVSQLNSANVLVQPVGAPAFDKTHYYVQYQQGNTWVDLDPMPGINPGGHLGTVDLGFDGAAIPDNRYATVAFAVSAVQAGSPQPVQLLASTLKSADLIGVAEHLFVSPDGTNDFSKAATATSFTPALVISGNTISGTAIDLSATGANQVNAVTFTITSTPPGGIARTYARTIFTRPPNASVADAAVQLSNAYDIVVTAGEFNPSFQVAHEIVAMGEAVAPSSNDPPMPYSLIQFFHLDGMVGRALGAQYGGLRFTPDRPMIAMIHRGFDATKSPEIDVDIVDNGLRATATNPSDALAANVARGYLDTIVEQHLIDGQTVGAPQVFAAAAQNGTASTVLAPSAQSQIASLPFDADTRAQIRATLTSGAAAIVTSKAVALGGVAHIAWWSIDPTTGNTVGRLETGAGQAIEEYNQLQAKIAAKGGPLVQFYGDFWRCIAFGVEAPLEGQSGVAGEVAFLDCVANAYCHLLQSVLMDQIPEDKAASAMEAQTIREALQRILQAKAQAIASANFGKGKLNNTIGAACDAAFSSPFGK
ncbi:MAG: hypothetical protein ACYDA1_06110 [Vulcanimicrobiaceae bacterium]